MSPWAVIPNMTAPLTSHYPCTRRTLIPSCERPRPPRCSSRSPVTRPYRPGSSIDTSSDGRACFRRWCPSDPVASRSGHGVGVGVSGVTVMSSTRRPGSTVCIGYRPEREAHRCSPMDPGSMSGSHPRLRPCPEALVPPPPTPHGGR